MDKIKKICKVLIVMLLLQVCFMNVNGLCAETTYNSSYDVELFKQEKNGSKVTFLLKCPYNQISGAGDAANNSQKENALYRELKKLLNGEEIEYKINVQPYSSYTISSAVVNTDYGKDDEAIVSGATKKGSIKNDLTIKTKQYVNGNSTYSSTSEYKNKMTLENKDITIDSEATKNGNDAIVNIQSPIWLTKENIEKYLIIHYKRGNEEKKEYEGSITIDKDNKATLSISKNEANYLGDVNLEIDVSLKDSTKTPTKIASETVSYNASGISFITGEDVVAYDMPIKVEIKTKKGSKIDKNINVTINEIEKEYKSTDLEEYKINYEAYDSYKLEISGIGGTYDGREVAITVKYDNTSVTRKYKIFFAPPAYSNDYGIYTENFGEIDVFVTAKKLGTTDITKVTGEEMYVYTAISSSFIIREVTVKPNKSEGKQNVTLYDINSVTKFRLNETSKIDIIVKYSPVSSPNSVLEKQITINLSQIYVSNSSEKLIYNPSTYIYGESINNKNFSNGMEGYILSTVFNNSKIDSKIDSEIDSKILRGYLQINNTKRCYYRKGALDDTNIRLITKINIPEIKKIVVGGARLITNGEEYVFEYPWQVKPVEEISKTQEEVFIKVKMEAQNGLDLSNYDYTKDNYVKFIINPEEYRNVIVRSITIEHDNVKYSLKNKYSDDNNTFKGWQSESINIKGVSEIIVRVHIEGFGMVPFTFPLKSATLLIVAKRDERTINDELQKGDSIRIIAQFPDNLDDVNTYLEVEGEMGKIKQSIAQYKKYGSTYQNNILTYSQKVGTKNAGKTLKIVATITDASGQILVTAEKEYEVAKLPEDVLEMEDLTGYGNPDDLGKLLDPNLRGSVAYIIKDYASMVGAILLYVSIVMIGINIILNRNKAEERVNTMSGFMYVCIGVLLFSCTLIIYGMLGDVVKNSNTEQVDSTVDVVPTETTPVTKESEESELPREHSEGSRSF